MNHNAFLKKRAAISAVFLANGLAVGCWAVLVPVVIRNLAISESDMGLIILGGGLSAIFALAVSPAIIARFGVRGVVLAAGIILSPTLFLIVQMSSAIIAALFLMFVMAGLAIQDVAMNADAGELENESGRTIMSSFHGFWSAGAMIGALAGAPILAQYGAMVLTILVGLCALAIPVIAFPHLSARTREDSLEAPMPKTLPRQLLPWLFGIIALAGFTSEGAVIDWSAHFLRSELASGTTLSGIAFGSFSATMMLARFAGDGLRERFGDRRLFTISVIIAGIGLALASLAPTAGTAALGFALAGFGNANIVPVAFSAASRIKGLPKGAGIAAATFCGYAGLLFAPAGLGAVGEHFGFRTVFALMAVFLVLTLALTPRLGVQQAAPSN